MNRRDALKLLASLPLLAFLKPEAVEAKVEPKRGRVFTGYATSVEFSTNEGETWESLACSDWVEPEGGKTLTFGPDGVLYVSGDFLYEDIEQARQRHYKHYRLTWDGESFSTLK